MKRVLLLLCMLVAFGNAFAQSDPPLRLEFTAVREYHDYHTLAVDTNGVLLFYEGVSQSTDTAQWICVSYDTNLQKNNYFSIALPARSEWICATYSQPYAFVIFQKRTPNREPVQTHLLTLDLRNGKYLLRQIQQLTHPKLTACTAHQHHLSIFAQGEQRDRLYLYDFLQDKLKEVMPEENYFFDFCTVDTFKNQWLVGVTERNKKQIQRHLYTYDWEEQRERIWTLPAQDPITYTSLRALPVNSESTLLIGIYNTNQERYANLMYSGIYTMLWNDTLQAEPRHYKFTSLKSAGQEQNYANLSSKEQIDFQLLVAPTAQHDNQYSFVTEVFYPEYTYNYTGFDAFGYGIPTTTFAGYRFVNAYITTFDSTGALKWDAFLPLSQMLTKTIHPHIQMHYFDSEALIYYPLNNRIVNTLLENGKTVIKLSDFMIETSSSREIVEFNRNTNIEHWYGNNFIISGYQSLYNKSKRNTKRYVFFINKVQYW